MDAGDRLPGKPRERVGRLMAGEQIPVAVLLEFERAHPGGGGRKWEAVYRTFGISLARWYQQLSAALRTREALEHDAALVRFLLERMETRSRRRAALLMRRRSR